MSEFAPTLDLVVRNALLQSTAIFLVGLLLARFAVRRPARVHTVLVLAFLAAIVAPLASEAVRRGGWGLLPPEVRQAESQGAIAVRSHEHEHELAIGQLPGSHTMSGAANVDPAEVERRSRAMANRTAPNDSDEKATTPTVVVPTIVTDAARATGEAKPGGHDVPAVVVRSERALLAWRLVRGVFAGRRVFQTATPCDEPAVLAALAAARDRLEPAQRPRRSLPIARRALPDDLVLVVAPQGVAAAGRRAQLVGRRVDAHSLSRAGALETARPLGRARRGSRVLPDALAGAGLVGQAAAGARQRTSLRRLDRGGGPFGGRLRRNAAGTRRASRSAAGAGSPAPPLGTGRPHSAHSQPGGAPPAPRPRLGHRRFHGGRHVDRRHGHLPARRRPGRCAAGSSRRDKAQKPADDKTPAKERQETPTAKPTAPTKPQSRQARTSRGNAGQGHRHGGQRTPASLELRRPPIADGSTIPSTGKLSQAGRVVTPDGEPIASADVYWDFAAEELRSDAVEWPAPVNGCHGQNGRRRPLRHRSRVLATCDRIQRAGCARRRLWIATHRDDS